MEKEYICRCNNCGNILLDENPQQKAEKQELTGEELSMVQLNTDNISNSEDKTIYYFWVCPVCKTDEYLTDLLW